MENASDALIMAGQILIFLVALTLCISSFSDLRTNIDRIIGQTEVVELAKDGDEYINYIQSKDGNSTRIVGAETVVSSMYRAIKENYVVYIKLNENSDYESIKDKVIIKNATKDIKVGNNAIINKDDKIIEVGIGEGKNQDVNKILSDGKLFDTIKDKNFQEYLGEYQASSEQAVTRENKITYRIITYVQNI